jgi:tetratricopeptide (TPR) repeat protein
MIEGEGIFQATGTVYALNDIYATGQIRLIDNRRVHFAYSAVKKDSPRLKLKDAVALEVVLREEGLVARSLWLSAEEGEACEPTAPVEATESAKSKTSSGNIPKAIATPRPPLPPSVQVAFNASAQDLYAQAAVARTEGRTADARALFERSIAAGGGADIYVAYFKLLNDGRDLAKARDLMNRAIAAIPRPDFYVMYGHMERRAANLPEAESILRAGAERFPGHVLLKTGLAQVLAQIATTGSLKEAGEIFDSLDAVNKLNKSDRTYMRFRALAQNPRAGRAYSYFDKLNGFFPEIAGRRDSPPDATDLIVEIKDQELDGSFGISGGYLVRCFTGNPKRSDIIALSKQLRSLTPEATVGLISGREVPLNSTLAFVVIPKTSVIRDYLMSVLSENNEAVLAIDDQFIQNSQATANAKASLRELFSQYLGARDLYDSTLPVSGRRLFGRERLLVSLADHVQRGDFIGVFGLRKMGKTSLMYQLRDEKLRDDAVAYVDLQASPGLAISSFLPVLWEIERDLLERHGSRHPRVAKILRLGNFARYSDAVLAGLNPALLFSEDIREFLDAIVENKLPGINRLVIIIDELERCLPLAGQAPMTGYIEFFGLLRGLAQTERYRGAISSVVVAANASISEKAYWEGRENPVFSLYKQIFIPPLSKADTAHMVQMLGKGMSVYWENSATDEVFRECGGHPFLTRVLCSYVAKQFIQRPLQISKHMVEDVGASFIRDKSDKFEQITELLHAHFPQEELLLENLALGRQPVNPSDENIRHLIGYQLITKSGANYTIAINALNSWLRKRGGERND